MDVQKQAIPYAKCIRRKFIAKHWQSTTPERLASQCRFNKLPLLYIPLKTPLIFQNFITQTVSVFLPKTIFSINNLKNIAR